MDAREQAKNSLNLPSKDAVMFQIANTLKRFGVWESGHRFPYHLDVDYDLAWKEDPTILGRIQRKITSHPWRVKVEWRLQPPYRGDQRWEDDWWAKVNLWDQEAMNLAIKQQLTSFFKRPDIVWEIRGPDYVSPKRY